MARITASKTRGKRTRRGGRNVLTADALRKELVACSEAHAQFQLTRDQSVSERTAAPEVWQRLRLTLIEALKDQERHYYAAFNAGQLTEQVLPVDMARFVREALQDTAAGDSHPLFAPLPIPGGRGNRLSARIRTLVDRAIDYLTAVDLGLLADRNARQIVSVHYGVTGRQVGRWLGDAGGLEARQALMEARYQERLPGPVSRLNPKILRKLMEWGGEAYQQAVRQRKR